MGAIISKLCCCAPKRASNLRKRLPSLIIERSQITTADESELTQYTRVLERDFDVDGRRGWMMFSGSGDDISVKGGNVECKLFRLRHRRTGQRFTLTRFPKQKLPADFYRNLCREIELLATSLPHHPSLINLYWSWQDGEYLYRVDDAGSRIGDDDIVNDVCGLVVGIHYIHSYGLVHGNINPHTAILKSNGQLRLSGFNHLRRVSGGKRLRGPSGDFPDFQAPECTEESEYFEEIDWYSLGKCLQFWMEAGRMKRDVDLLDLIDMLTVERGQDRLGYGPAGFKSIQSHPFFAQVHWLPLLKQKETLPRTDHLPHLKASIDSLKSTRTASTSLKSTRTLSMSVSLDEFVEFSWDETGEIGEMLERSLCIDR